MALKPEWQETVDRGVVTPAAADYDSTIKSEIAAYDARFKTTIGYPTLDWKLFKAMLFVESGGPLSPYWKARVMQMGNPGDPAYGVLRRGEEHSDIIMAYELQRDLKRISINDPILNIRAAIAWVLTKAARLSLVSRPSQTDMSQHSHIITKRDTLSSIAHLEHTTIPELRTSNREVNPHTLRIGRRLLFHRAAMIWEISLWQKIDVNFVSDKYNGGRDVDYAEKLRYVLKLL